MGHLLLGRHGKYWKESKKLESHYSAGWAYDPSRTPPLTLDVGWDEASSENLKYGIILLSGLEGDFIYKKVK